MLMFGRVPTYQSDDQFDLGISDDQRALTLTFSDFQVAIEGGKSAAPIATRIFSLALPLEGDEERVEIAFRVSAVVLTDKGATATMVFSVNGQTTIADHTGNADQDFVQELKFASARPPECRLCLFLLVGRYSNAQGVLKVTDIDAEILPSRD